MIAYFVALFLFYLIKIMAAPLRIFQWFLVFSYFISIGVQATDQVRVSIGPPNESPPILG
jgi:hypothetical protein